MSLSKQPIRHIAAPVIGAMDFIGLKNNIILLEYDDNDNALRYLSPALKNKASIVLTADEDDVSALHNGGIHTVALRVDRVTKGARWVKSLAESGAKIDYIIFHRVDLMDINAPVKLRGANLKGQLSLIGSRILKGANIIVTSAQCEWGVREIADRFIDLK